MSDNSIQIQILNKDYHVNCQEKDRHELFASVELLNNKMSEIKSNGKVLSTEKVAIMAALNLAHDLHQLIKDNKELAFNVNDKISNLCDKLSEITTIDVQDENEQEKCES